ncbi:MAG: hypothetical protein U0T75_10195 [Chitinophagales bacterium]
MFTLLKDIYYSFPIQLLLLSFKRYQFLLLSWVFFFIIVVGKFGSGIGVPSTFLDPEYLGKVGYLSFAIVGLGMGVFYVTWNVVMYILHSHRFPFMASLQYPLGMFFLNNSIIPFLFIVSYIASVIHFQITYEFQGFWDLMPEIAGFLAGFIFILLITSAYFGVANPTTGSYLAANKEKIRRRKSIRRVQFNEAMETEHFNRVDFYLTNKLRLRHTRTVEHYDPGLHRLVFRRHHLNAFIAFIIILGFLTASGFFLEYPLFQVPIVASGFLFFSVIVCLFSMFLYWTGGWGMLAVMVFLFTANYLTKFDVFGSMSTVYGLNYETKKAEYSMRNLRAISTDSIIQHDKDYFVTIFDNWKKKNINKAHPERKPMLYFINVSGGGLRSAMFVTAILQQADSLAGGALFDKTFMISGASGGMFGTTYLRELFLRKKNGQPINMQDPMLPYNVSRDVLNPIGLSIINNDALLPYHKFELNGHKYFKDRGYIFERFFCDNTGLDFQKTIGDYMQPEYEAKVPLMIYHTTVINDSRRFFISPHPVSFLMRPFGNDSLDEALDIDAIDFCRMFEQQDARRLLVTSAMRMDATFPFILPNPVLPTEPQTYVMDGGALDNFGTETSIRFMKTFREWIKRNTSGVVIIQIRDSEKLDEPEAITQRTLVNRLTDPLGTVYKNMENMHDFLTDQRLNDLDQDLKGNLHFVLFEYTSTTEDDKAAMSMHVTTRDKNDIMRSLHRANNVAAFNKLQRILSSK